MNTPKSFPSAEANALASGALDVLRRARVCDSLAAALGGCVLADLGTVDKTLHKAVKNAKSGQVTYRVDKAGIVHCTIGKANFGFVSKYKKGSNVPEGETE